MRRFRRRNRQSAPIPAEAQYETSAAPSPADVPAAEAADEYDTYDDPDIEPFVPVSGGYYDELDFDNAAPVTATVKPPRTAAPRTPSLPARAPRRLPGALSRIQWSYLLLVSFLFGAGVFGVMLRRDEIHGNLADWWPLALLSVSGLWMLIALMRRQIASFLGGSAFAGVGLSFLLDTQAIATVEETMLGLVLVTAGLGIVIRGFLLRQRPV